MALQIVGAGFGRTGTDSMRRALVQLGFAPCHHMHEVHEKPDHVEQWLNIATGKSRDWAKALDGFQASVDWPSIAFWRDISEVYPNAKLLLTWRPVEAWFKSFSKTILPLLHHAERQPESERALVDKMLLAVIRDVSFRGEIHDEASMRARYEEHNAEVEAAVPEGQRLTFAAGDGWEPLCAWLGVPVPETPFPHSNTTADFNAAVQRDRH